MKEILKPALVLFIIAAAAAVCVGASYEVTKQPIAAAKERERQAALKELIPEADGFEPLPSFEGAGGEIIYFGGANSGFTGEGAGVSADIKPLEFASGEIIYVNGKMLGYALLGGRDAAAVLNADGVWETRAVKDLVSQGDGVAYVTDALAAVKNGETIGFIASSEGYGGYSGAVGVMTALDPEGTITGVKVVSQRETPGLGANAEKPAFSGQYKGKSGRLSVTKTAPSENEIVAITSATLTTRAVTNAVNAALGFYNDVIRGAAR
ncbi:MAG: FMN-binding protein [Clostridiales bacterium]|jgi:RnfABCDGE-type electron transport complex G subunit|nr:FMN-binding protein [Clostridiales bacterium]